MTDRGSYRSISTVLARGKDFRRLSPPAKLVFYTVKMELGPSGIDVYDVELLPKYTGLSDETAERALDELRSAGWLDWEDNVVWVVRGLEFEPGLNPHNANHRKSVASHLNGLPRLAIVQRFRVRYAGWLNGKPDEPGDPSGYHADGIGMVSEDHRDQGKGKGKGDGKGEGNRNNKAPAAVASAPSGSPDLFPPQPDSAPPTPSQPAVPARGGKGRGKAATDDPPRYPHYPVEACNALYAVWTDRVGGFKYSRFRSETAALFDRPGGQYPTAVLEGALRLAVEVLKHRAESGKTFDWERFTPAVWVGRIAYWVQCWEKVQADPLYYGRLMPTPGVRAAA